MERYAPGVAVTLDDEGGVELLVVDGAFASDGETFVKQSWLRLPKGEATTLKAGPAGTTVWVKSGHLATPPTAPIAA